MFLLLLVLGQSPSLGVPAGVSAGTQPRPWCSCWCQWCDTAQALVFLLVSVVWHSPSLGVPADVSGVTQPKPWCSCWCQWCDTAQALVFLLMSVVWHSPSLCLFPDVLGNRSQPSLHFSVFYLLGLNCHFLIWHVCRLPPKRTLSGTLKAPRRKRSEELWRYSKEPLKQPLLKKLIGKEEHSSDACLCFLDILLLHQAL